LPKEDVYSFKVNKDVVKFISENDGMIDGVVGLNWLYQQMTWKGSYKNISVLN
jgi:phosphate transport system substrate-binding protein